MGKIIALVLCLISAGITFSQKVVDLTVETTDNQTERDAILKLAEERITVINEEIVFDLEHLKTSDNYAWFQGNVMRQDGETIQFPEESGLDCCHAEGLFEKRNGIWEVVVFYAFSTDCWYCEMSRDYPEVPKKIFPKGI